MNVQTEIKTKRSRFNDLGYCLNDIINRLNEIFFHFGFHSNFLVSMSILVKDRKGNVPSRLPYLCLVSSSDSPNDLIRCFTGNSFSLYLDYVSR